jgi:hypothetical protein
MGLQGTVPKIVVAGAMLFATGVGVAPLAVAQDASGTPGAMESEMQGTHNHPAHIHSGTCDTLGDVVFPLENLTGEGMMGTPMAGEGMMGTPAGEGSTESADASGTPAAGMEMEGEEEMGQVVAMSTTDVQASLDDILAAEHAINVHESEEAIEVYIACGEITGTAENGELEVYLNELNDSGYTGEAILRDNGDGTTTVDVMLMQSGEMEGMAEATPSS